MALRLANRTARVRVSLHEGRLWLPMVHQGKVDAIEAAAWRSAGKRLICGQPRLPDVSVSGRAAVGRVGVAPARSTCHPGAAGAEHAMTSDCMIYGATGYTGRLIAARTRRTDLGDGERLAMAIPWGDVSTACHSTGIPDIDATAARPVEPERPDRTTHNRPRRARESNGAQLRLGEVVNARGQTGTASVVMANGYSVTALGAVMAARHLLDEPVAATRRRACSARIS